MVARVFKSASEKEGEALQQEAKTFFVFVLYIRLRHALRSSRCILNKQLLLKAMVQITIEKGSVGLSP
jgi:hypothetical protein